MEGLITERNIWEDKEDVGRTKSLAMSLIHCMFHSVEVKCATPEESKKFKMFLRMRIEEVLRKIPHQTALGSLRLDLLQDTRIHDGSVA